MTEAKRESNRMGGVISKRKRDRERKKEIRLIDR